MSLQSTPKKRYEITNHPLSRSDSSDEDVMQKDKFISVRSKSEDISRTNLKIIDIKNLRQIKCFCKDKSETNLALHSNESTFERWKIKLLSSFEHYNSVLQQALALSPFRRRIVTRRTRSLTRGDENNSKERLEGRDVIELDQVAGILKSYLVSQDAGHNFVSVIMNRPTWCDNCGKYILGYYHHCLQCPLCLFTCHVMCRSKVALECPSLRLDRILGVGHRLKYETSINACPRLAVSVCHDNGVEKIVTTPGRTTEEEKKEDADSSSIISGESEQEFTNRINIFNENKQGLSLKLLPNSLEGSIRVHMNLFRPITCISSPLPVTNDGEDKSESVQACFYKTSFQLPRDTSKLMHINDITTAEEVIELLLKKFCITNDPKSFALYHKSTIHDNVHTMRKLNCNELPLVLCLHWFYQGPEALSSNKFILQEIDPGEILWESFSRPELDNFLAMLNKEEGDHEEKIRNKFRIMKLHIERMMKEISEKGQMKTSSVLDML